MSGKREWRNNKISAANNGFIMGMTVKDEAPTADSPEPSFSINGEYWRIEMRSSNGDGPAPTHKPSFADPRNKFKKLDLSFTCFTIVDFQLDKRPSFWEKPNGNWARLELNGWKVHHTRTSNWAQNADLHLNGWQFSDNQQNYVTRASENAYGAQKSVVNSVFVGMTKNTGHRYCSNSFSYGVDN